MNVIDQLRTLSPHEIKKYCENTSISASVAMINIEGDFNFSTMVRNANFFGFKNCINISNSKRWDKRGSVGTHHYTTILHYPSELQFIEKYKYSHTLIGVENNINFTEKTINIFDLEDLYINPIFIFGSEKNGLSNFVLNNCHQILTINNFGSVRSLNVGTASGIVMSYYRNLIEEKQI